ncbi:MAG: protein kinase [Deltaproteobacteria bacterium]|nr:protein kinase [Deltaproteobacteria bacterium]
MLNPVQLPPRYGHDFVLLGSGGFGAVYLIEDHELGLRVAVKVPTGTESRRQARAVLLELRAAAALRHRGFVQVLDADLDEAGVPYLVMEFADGGGLQDQATAGPLSWEVAAPWIRELFEGLAYAHARGLVHRDVKLDNVLLKKDDEGVLHAKLADFGLTKVETGGDYASTRLLAGTLLYMAPEAFEEDATLIHPGVDLYAMGVLMYLLLGGRSPWSAKDLALISAKLDGRHRPLEPGPTLPSHVCEVVNRLLDPDARSRYQLAADVIADLFDPSGARAPSALSQTIPGLDEDSAMSRPPSLLTQLPRDADAVTQVLPTVRTAPPALAIVREPFFLGRAEERAKLWNLARLAGSGPVGVTLLGASGSGRSRLARWLASALEEGGFARTLHVRLDATTAPSDSLAASLRRFLLIGHASGGELRSRVAAWFRAHGHDRAEDVETLVSWLDPASSTLNASVLDAREAASLRRALLEKVLRLESRRGLVCVWWEETAASTTATQAAAELLRSAGTDPYPVLMVYERESEDALPEALAEWTPLVVGPLPEPFVRELLLDLGVFDEQADAVARRAKGNPARAVEAARLLCSGRGALAGLSVTEDRVELPGGTSSSILPVIDDPFGDTADVPPEQLALVRLDAFCSGDATGDAVAQAARARLVKLLALLPRPCGVPRLRRLWPTEAGRPEALDNALEDAAVAGIVRSDQDGYLEFTGAPLAAAAMELVERSPDAAVLRRACAAELSMGVAAPPGLLWAAAALLRDAGDLLGAIDRLVAAARLFAQKDFDSAQSVWDEAQAAVDQAGLADDAPQRVQVLLGAAQTARKLGNVDRVEELLSKLEPTALEASEAGSWYESHAGMHALRTDLPRSREEAEKAIAAYQEAGEGPGLARARLSVGDVMARAGMYGEAVAVFEQARADAEAASEVRTALWARWLRARCLRGLGRNEEAQVALEEVCERAASLGVEVVVGGAERELGNLALRGGRAEEADGLLRRSAERLERVGRKVEAAVTRISLGELARARGALSEARAEYSTAFAVARAYGLTSEVVVTLINLGIVELAMGRARRAGRRLNEIDKLLPRDQAHGLRRYIEALRVACLAEKGSWEDAEETVDALTDGGALPPDPDLLWLLEHAGTKAIEAGEPALGADALDLALGIAEAMKDSVAAERLRAAMLG